MTQKAALDVVTTAVVDLVFGTGYNGMAAAGLLPQYANILLPVRPCPVEGCSSALINLPIAGL